MLAFGEDRAITSENILKADQEREKKESDRKIMIDKLKKVGQNQISKEDTNDDDFIKKLQTKIMLVTKHPEIKNPKKKVKVGKCKFKHTSIKDVIPPIEEVKKKKGPSVWNRIWRDGDAAEYEKKLGYCAQEDFSVPVENNDEEKAFAENYEDEGDFISKNKLLQDKYNKDFHSHVISTGTVSLVADNRQRNIVNRKVLFQPDNIF